MPVTAFTAIKLRRWLTRRWGKAAPATWNARLTASRVLIGYCQRQGWLERDPATCLERRRTPRDETRAVPFEALEALAGLTAEFLAPCPGGGKAGFHTLAEQVTFELSDPGQHRGHHPPVRRIELEGHAVHGGHGHLPAGKLVERIEKVLR